MSETLEKTPVSNVRSYFEQIKNEPSKNLKRELLAEFGSDTLFTKTLAFVFDPMVTTGISRKRIDRVVNDKAAPDVIIADMGALLDYLRENNKGRDADLLVIKGFVDTLEDPADQTFVKQVVSKDVKIGVSPKTLNAVFGTDEEDFVFEFSPMLAADFNKRQHKLSEEFYITQKIDGIRCVAIKESAATVKFYTRAGQEILGLVELEAEIVGNDSIPVGQTLDGELLISDTTGLGVGEMFRQTQRTVRKDGEKTGVSFLVFETLPTAEFKAGVSQATYAERRAVLESIFSDTDNSLVKPLPVLYQGTDRAMITLEAENADAAGFEGVMVNSADGIYLTKRTDALQKVKSFKSADLLCVGVVEGTGKHVGRLGAIAVEYRGGITHVGTGFSDIEREEYFAQPDVIVGSVIEVKYFEETTDSSTGQPSLRFPVFVGVRDDKTADDTNIE